MPEIHLSKDELHLLARAIYVADWVANSHAEEESERRIDLDEVRRKVKRRTRLQLVETLESPRRLLRVAEIHDASRPVCSTLVASRPQKQDCHQGQQDKDHHRHLQQGHAPAPGRSTKLVQFHTRRKTTVIVS